MGRLESFYSENLLGARNLSRNVYRSVGDDPSYLRADLSKTTVAIAFRGILDPHVFQATATKFGECQSGFPEWLKDGKNQPAFLHQGSLNQFLNLLDNPRFQEENFPARLALRAAGRVLKQQRENLTKLENEVKGKIEVAIKEIEEYRAQCLRNGTGYYDSFKKKQHRTDFDANLNRLKLAGWLDEIITMISKDELPDDFQCSEVWIRLGTHYRLLVEPLDIANYYRLRKNEDFEPYLRNARPRRYTILQKWLEENNVIQQQQPSPTGSDQPTMLTQDSCLWAHVEEIACLTLANNAGGHENSIAGLEKSLRHLIDYNGLSIEELVAGNSTFNSVVKRLWENMTPLQKSSSPISDVIGRHPELVN